VAQRQQRNAPAIQFFSSRGFPGFFGIFRPLAFQAHLAAGALVMPPAVVWLVAGAVDRQRLDAQLQQPLLREHLGQQVQHAAGRPRFEDHPEGAPQRVVARRLAQADVGQPVRRVAQNPLGLAVAEPQPLPHDQAGEQLRQRELVPAEAPEAANSRCTPPHTSRMRGTAPATMSRSAPCWPGVLRRSAPGEARRPRPR